MLPDNSTVVQLWHSRKTVSVPKPSNEIEAVEGHLEGANAQERCWLDHSMKLIEKGDLNKDDTIAWLAYHASPQPIHPTLAQLLPLFLKRLQLLL